MENINILIADYNINHDFDMPEFLHIQNEL